MGIFNKFWTSLWLTYNYLKMIPQLIVGAWKIGRLPQPVVSVFGGSRLKINSVYVQWARELSHRLVKHGISVITGGGPGIMEAANWGASYKDAHTLHTMGIGVRGLTHEDLPNQYVKDFVLTDYFEMRKYLLINYSYAYVVFPGGFGTISELSDVLTLVQTKKIPRRPIVLMGTEYWFFFMEWVKRAEHEGLLSHDDAQLIFLADNMDKAVEYLVTYCQRCMNAAVNG